MQVYGAQWLEPSPLTKEARVRILDRAGLISGSRLSLVLAWIRGFFSGFSGFPPSTKPYFYQHFIFLWKTLDEGPLRGMFYCKFLSFYFFWVSQILLYLFLTINCTSWALSSVIAFLANSTSVTVPPFSLAFIRMKSCDGSLIGCSVVVLQKSFWQDQKAYNLW